MKTLDTFEDFLEYWFIAKSKTLNQQIELWRTSYMAKYPELLEKQIRSYSKDGIDWREVAKHHVFPNISEHLPLMKKARENFPVVSESIHNKANHTLDLNIAITYVMYVGIGCGAGWATQYEGQPACLLGLENVAECKWHTQEKLEKLLAHEIGHLAHMSWRNEWESFEYAEQDPLFQLYSEGFAQRCEHTILAKETWHQGHNESWVSWCELNEGWLAREFLKRTQEGIPVRGFFGSWFDIQGKKNTGYFLGHEFIRNLEETYSLRQIALFDVEKVRKLVVIYLKSISD